jgi:hypothetical protein
MLERDFRDMMAGTVTVYAPGSVDKYGKRTAGTVGVAYPARVQETSRDAKTEDGRAVTVVADVYLYGAPTVTTGHKVVMPDASTPIIVAVYTSVDQASAYCTKISVGR